MHHICTKNEVVDFFQRGFRTDLGSPTGEPRWVGLENEYLMVASDGSIIAQDILEHLWRELRELGWSLETDDISHKVIAATRNRADLVGKKHYHYDVITTDLGYATLEIDLAPARTLIEAQHHLYDLLSIITSILSKFNAYLLGYGVQPVSKPGRGYLGQRSRYPLMLDLCDEENEESITPHHVDVHTIDAACQTQVEISAQEAITVVNAMNATSGLRVALLANSPIWQNQISDYKSIRQMFVDRCWPSRKNQLGIPPRFHCIEHYIDYLLDFRPIMVKRQQTLYKINNHIPFRQFLFDEAGQAGVSLDGHKKHLFGTAEDIKLQCGLAWFTSRLQPTYGTIEDRVSCQQPPDAPLCAPALTLGLTENYRALDQIADTLSLDQWGAIHQLTSRYGMDFSYPGIDLPSLLRQMLEIASQGLRSRGFNEEVFLTPLYQRLEKKRCPADEIQETFLNEGIRGIIACNDMRNALRSPTLLTK